MLIRTITMETSDDLLFSKESPLLPAAAELAFHTVNCSALNAEELRRENGLEVIGSSLRLILTCPGTLVVPDRRLRISQYKCIWCSFSFSFIPADSIFYSRSQSAELDDVAYKVAPVHSLKKQQAPEALYLLVYLTNTN